MKVDKYAIMEILRERGCHSFDEHNYKEMPVTLEVGWDAWSQKRTEDDYVVEFAGGTFERITHREYVKKSRNHKINEILRIYNK